MLEYEIADRSSPEPIKPWDAFVTILALNDKGLVPPYPGNRPEYTIVRNDYYEPSVIGTRQIFQNRADLDKFWKLHYYRWSVTEETWAKAHWPPVLMDSNYTLDGRTLYWALIEEVETDLPKPTWQQVETANQERRIRYIRASSRPFVEYVEDASNNALISEINTYDPNLSLDPGEGLDHLSAVVHQIARTTAAGMTNTVSVLRDADHQPRVLWTEKHKTEILDPIAAKAVFVGSAVNVVKGRILKLQEIAYSENGGLGPHANEHQIAAARFAALEKAIELAQHENLDADIAEEMDNLRDATLPDDLVTAKQVLVERLESAATGQQKLLKSGLTQQAVDNWATCVDQNKALGKIAEHCVLGSIAIRKADDTIWHKAAGAWGKSSFAAFILGLSIEQRTTDADVQHEGEGPPDASLGKDGEYYRDTASGIKEAKASFDEHKTKVESVTAANTPVWVVNDTAINNAHAKTSLTDTRTMTVRAVQPGGVTIEGEIDITLVPRVTYKATGAPAPAIRTLRRGNNPIEHEALIVLPISVTETVTVVVQASNLCGPSMIEIDVKL